MTAEAWVVLDVDDVLVDTWTVGWQKMHVVAGELGLPPATLADYRRLYATVPFGEVVAALWPDTDVTAFAGCYDRLTGYPARPLGDVRALLAAAATHGYRTAVLTNGPANKTIRKLQACGVTKADVDLIRDGDPGRPRKPELAAYQDLIDRAGLRPGASWFVSDQAPEWAAAEALGFQTVGVVAGAVDPHPCGFLPRLMLPGLDSLTELLPLLHGAGPVPAHQPLAVGFDFGFTLADHVRGPAEVLASCCRPPRPTAEARRAVAEVDLTRLRDLELWTEERRIAGALAAVYGEAASRLGNDPVGTAARTVAAYTAPANWAARPGAAAALAEVRAAGLAVGVLSNWQPNLDTTLAACGLDGLVDVAYASSTLGLAKPDPAAFEALAAKLGVAIDRLLFVGDDVVWDAGGALAAGARAAVVAGPWTDPGPRAALELVLR